MLSELPAPTKTVHRSGGQGLRSEDTILQTGGDAGGCGRGCVARVTGREEGKAEEAQAFKPGCIKARRKADFCVSPFALSSATFQQIYSIKVK